MRKFIVTLRFVCGLLLAMVSAAVAEPVSGLVSKESKYPVAETIDRLSAIVTKKGVSIFARIDHAAGARQAGIEMAPTQVLIFGNPMLGTPLIQAQRRIGLDLPMKVLAWQDDDGKVWLTYRDPADLKRAYAVSGADDAFARVAGALDAITTAAAD